MDVGANKNSLSTFVVSPNYSMSWRENKIFIASLTVVSFSIAGGFALQGFWLILPFAGLEIFVFHPIVLSISKCDLMFLKSEHATNVFRIFKGHLVVLES